jgi:ATP-dependent Lon protease
MHCSRSSKDYTREAGVRNLEREIGNVCRYVAMRIAEGLEQKMHVGAADLHAILGPLKYERTSRCDRHSRRGHGARVDAGRRRHPVHRGGATPGGGKLILTGQLGDVMKESAQGGAVAAEGAIGAAGHRAGVAGEVRTSMSTCRPAATPKDGPSAGVAMFVALTSLLTGRPVRSDLR